jgi:predicted CXXCH cytochrome family protein
VNSRHPQTKEGKVKKIALAVMFLLAAPSVLWAFGPHDNECVECHGMHTAEGGALIGVQPFTPDNPNTGGTVQDVSSLCLGCHSTQGGILEVDLMRTHPIGIIPKRAQVPRDNLSRDGTLTCTSCHDGHPSNANYMYLRAEVTGPGDMGSLCGICHAAMREQ